MFACVCVRVCVCMFPPPALCPFLCIAPSFPLQTPPLVDGACLDFVIVSLCNAAEPEKEWARRTLQQYCDG